MATQGLDVQAMGNVVAQAGSSWQTSDSLLRVQAGGDAALGQLSAGNSSVGLSIGAIARADHGVDVGDRATRDLGECRREQLSDEGEGVGHEVEMVSAALRSRSVAIVLRIPPS